MSEFASLPPDLPVPEDDGAADHLPGSELPSVSLPVAGGGQFDFRGTEAAGTLVAFVYPRTGTPGRSMPAGWDDIPGARGCTPQSCSFRDRHEALTDLGAVVVGISAMDPGEQAAFAEREEIPYPLLNDGPLALRDQLGLPPSTCTGRRCTGASPSWRRGAGSRRSSTRCSRPTGTPRRSSAT